MRKDKSLPADFHFRRCPSIRSIGIIGTIVLGLNFLLMIIHPDPPAQDVNIARLRAAPPCINPAGPFWFNRDSEWRGTSVREGHDFCASRPGRLTLCTFDAICPDGEESMPVGGYREGPDRQWVPLISETDKTWVKVNGNGRTCITHPDPYHEEGSALDLVTSHIACCSGVNSEPDKVRVIETTKSIGWVRPLKVFGLIHMAKTAGSETNGEKLFVSIMFHIGFVYFQPTKFCPIGLN